MTYDIKDLKQDILNKKLKPLYVFIGDELALQDVYIKQIVSTSGLESHRVNDVKSVYGKLTSKSLIKAVPQVFIIRNDDEYFKAESTWKNLLKNDLKGNILILLYSGVEKKAKFCKAHENVLTEFKSISPSILKNRLNALTGLSLNYCEDFVKICGGNYGRLQNEIFKLEQLMYARGYQWNTAYIEAKKTNLIHEEIGDIIFDFTNAITERNIYKAYELYPKIMQTEDGSAIKLLSVLYNSFRNILMVQSTAFKERTEEILGIPQKQIFATARKCDKYNLFELVAIVKKIREIEKGIKIGMVEEKFAIPYFMGSIW